MGWRKYFSRMKVIDAYISCCISSISIRGRSGEIWVEGWLEEGYEERGMNGNCRGWVGECVPLCYGYSTGVITDTTIPIKRNVVHALPTFSGYIIVIIVIDVYVCVSRRRSSDHSQDAGSC